MRRCTWRREQDGVVGIGPVEVRAREESEQHAPRQLVSFDELQRLVEVIVEGVLSVRGAGQAAKGHACGQRGAVGGDVGWQARCELLVELEPVREAMVHLPAVPAAHHRQRAVSAAVEETRAVP